MTSHSQLQEKHVLIERVRLDGRGRVPLPSTIRKELGLREGDNLVWLVDTQNETLRLIKEGTAATLLATAVKERVSHYHKDG